jgi:hypothetical protein
MVLSNYPLGASAADISIFSLSGNLEITASPTLATVPGDYELFVSTYLEEDTSVTEDRSVTFTVSECSPILSLSFSD